MRGASSAPLTDSLTLAGIAVHNSDRVAEVARRFDTFLGKTPLASLPVGQRQYFNVAQLFAEAGKADRASAIVAEYDRAVTDTAQRRFDAPGRHRALGWIALAQGRPRDAVVEFREADRLPQSPCPMCFDPAIGRAFDAANMPDSAIAVFEHFVTAPYILKLRSDAFDLPWILRRLGELYEKKGDVAKAAGYYRQFIDLWKNADPDLQPQVEEARAKLKKLADVEPPAKKP